MTDSTKRLGLADAPALIEATYPEISLSHLECLTDRTGLIQHAIYAIPNRRTGYTTDDNSRALIVALRHYEMSGARRALQLTSTYLSFLHYAQIPSGKFHNFMSFDQVFLDGEGSEDCQGRTLWALGQCLAADIHANVKDVARELFRLGLWIPETCSSSRGRAYCAMGLSLYLRYENDDRVAEALANVADRLVQQLEHEGSDDWVWFEPFLTYCNAALPRSLFLAYGATGNERYLKAAEKTWAFLESQCICDGVLQIIGCNGWYFRGRDRAWFDQQPIDATMMTVTALDAYRITGNAHYLETARIAFDWFFGRNTLGVAVHDPVTGGCFDGLMTSGRNSNQGAESTVAGLLAQIEMAPYIKDGLSLFVEAR